MTDVISLESLSDQDLVAVARRRPLSMDTIPTSPLEEALPIMDSLATAQPLNVLERNEPAKPKARWNIFSRNRRSQAPERMTARPTSSWGFAGKIAVGLTATVVLGMGLGSAYESKFAPQHSRQPVAEAQSASPLENIRPTTTLSQTEAQQRWYNSLNQEQQANFYRMVGFITNLENNWGYTKDEAVESFRTAATYAYALQQTNATPPQG